MNKRKQREEGVYMRTRKRIKLAEYRGSARLQDLPVELIWKILDYLDDNCILNVHGLCPALSKAITLVFYHRCNIIPTRIRSMKNHLYHKLYSGSISEETRRLDITKSLLYLDWMETELVTLDGIMLRYDIDSESPLFRQLWHVLKEMLDRIDSLSRSIPFGELLADVRVTNPSTSLPLWSSFIDQFDEALEPTLGRSFPFETRVVDILSCCPSTNVDLIVDNSHKDDTAVVRAFFQIQDACCERYRPKLEGNTDKDIEKAVLRYLRFTVRTRNSLATTNIYDDIRTLECRLLSLTLDEDDRNKIVILLQEKYRRLLSSFYRPLTFLDDSEKSVKCFIRQSSYCVSNNFLECFLEKRELRPGEMPLLTIYPDLFKAKRIEKIKCRASSWKRHPFELRVVYKRWWQDINILVRKEDEYLEDDRELSYTVEQSIETSSLP